MTSPEEEYPPGATAYAVQTCAAWAAGDTERIAELTTPEAAAKLAAAHEYADRSWQYTLGEGGMGSQYCSFGDNRGYGMVMRMRADLLGGEHAVIDVRFDPMEYPNSANAYVDQFMRAWVGGDQPRMGELAVSDVVSYCLRHVAPKTWTLTSEHTAGHSMVRVTDGSGFDKTMQVTNQLLGQPHAITAIL